MGIPVVLVYLGFLHAVEMEDQGEPFASADGWRTAVLEYSQGIVPGAAWNEQPIATSKAPFYALIRSIDIDFHVERAKFD
ncbi:hypothetical protein JXD38_07350 [candidate division WOR-3 bacterium]|nr:hypothetical protein [candidate division WOR-3 bacterium]